MKNFKESIVKEIMIKKKTGKKSVDFSRMKSIEEVFMYERQTKTSPELVTNQFRKMLDCLHVVSQRNCTYSNRCK